jgi:hypothetical protein
MRTKLGNALFDKCRELQNNGVTFLKTYEIEFQGVIELLFPDKPWWKVTDCNIFMHLFEYQDPEKTIIEILKGYKEEK